MMDNHLYNLMNQLTQENKSLYKIKGHYTEDAGDCGDCKAFWGKMVKDKEEHIEELMGLIKGHMG
jgi:hypothetical protein